VAIAAEEPLVEQGLLKAGYLRPIEVDERPLPYPEQTVQSITGRFYERQELT